MIDFETSDSILLLNPRLPEAERARLESGVPHLRGHFFIATSGSSGAMKLVALSREAVLASAAAVNRRFDASSSDVWCAVLPEFHVGGLGILARAHLAGSRVVRSEWDAVRFADLCVRENVTLVSLVPAQVHDLVRARLRAPASVRGVLVGGGAFRPQLAAEADELGWPVFASYGATECCSTIAVADRSGASELYLLSHIEARTTAEGRLAFRGPSLLTGYAVPGGGLIDPRVEGWFVSEDWGAVDARRLDVRGRGSDFVKIGGESVDLGRLDAILEGIAGDSAAVLAMPDERLGHVIHLAVMGDGEPIRAAFDAQVLPFERARAVHQVASIPRSPLGKLLRSALVAEVRKRLPAS